MDNEKFQEQVLKQLTENAKFQESASQQFARIGEFQQTVTKQLDLIVNKLVGLAEGQGNLESRMDKLETRMTSLEVKIESQVVEKLSGLFDDRQVQNESIEELKSATARIEAKVDVLQLETTHLRKRRTVNG